MGSLFVPFDGAGDCTPGDRTDGEDWTGVSLAFTFFSGGCAAALGGLPGPRLMPAGGD